MAEIRRGALRSQPSIREIEEAITSAAKALGYVSLKPEQAEVVRKFVSGRDVLVALPTGAGKSLCFACLPLVYDSLRKVQHQSIVIVVSPLTALMQDQVANFTARGLKAAYIQGEGGDDVSGVLAGNVQLLYTSPETLILVPKWREMLRQTVYQTNIVCLVIDEAHLVEKWSDNFRTEFANISEIRSLLPHNIKLMALTATANVQTRAKVIKSLDMKGCFIQSHNPNKVNLYYEVLEKGSIDSLIKPIAAKICLKREASDRYIIFCRTYQDTNNFFENLTLKLADENTLLVDKNLNVRICEKFTACSAAITKKNVLKSFTQPGGLVRIIVATVAFGMGLDSPDVRFIIHWGPPSDVELYVQETGRGGRDGGSTLFYSKTDISKSPKNHVSEAMIRYCTNSNECRRALLMKQFTDDNVAVPNYLHTCCDLCHMVCMCEDCSSLAQPHHDTLQLPEIMCDKPQFVCDEIIQRELKTLLVAYRKRLFLTTPKEASLVGLDICTGFTMNTINAIVDSYPQLETKADLLDLGIGRNHHASVIAIIEQCTGLK